jgi:hypothetical protein
LVPEALVIGDIPE